MILVGSGVTSRMPRFKEATALHSTKNGIDVSGWCGERKHRHSLTFPFARYGSSAQQSGSFAVCSALGSNVMVAWFDSSGFDGQRSLPCVLFVHSRLVPVLGCITEFPLPGCVQVGEYDLEEMNSWLSFDRVALALSMYIAARNIASFARHAARESTSFSTLTSPESVGF
jgi:hypothetical protein